MSKLETAAEKASINKRRFVLLLMVVVCIGMFVRACGIASPMFERHPVRQYDTAAIARNFAEGAMNILYPQIDWRGNTSGYVECEFPAFQYIVAVAYRWFGLHEWMGRAVNILIYTVSALLLFQFGVRLFDHRVALLSILFYSFVPLSFLYTRTIQPDALMALSSLAGIYYFWRWADTGSWISIVLSATAITMAMLIKPTSAYLAFPLMYLCQRRFGWRCAQQPILWFFAVAVIVPPMLWYRHAATLWMQYGNSMIRFFVEYGSAYWWENNVLLRLGPAIGVRIVKYVATPAGLLLLLAGGLANPPRRNYLLHWWAAGFAVSMIVAARNYWGHDYYLLPVVFITSLWMALGAVRLWDFRLFSPLFVRPAVVALCIGVVAPTFYKLQDWTRPDPSSLDRVEFGRQLERLTEDDALIIIVEPARADVPNPKLFEHRTDTGKYLWGFPVDLYLSHRKGWTLNHLQATPELVQELRSRGAKYLATYFPAVLQRQPRLKSMLDERGLQVQITTGGAVYRLESP